MRSIQATTLAAFQDEVATIRGSGYDGIIEIVGISDEFEAICQWFMRNWGLPGPIRQARGPVMDFAGFLGARGSDGSSKRSIDLNRWPADDPGYLVDFSEKLETILDCFSMIRVPLYVPPKPRSLTAVVVCVGYARQLALTIPHNFPLVDQVVIATTSDDSETMAVVKSFGHWDSKIKLVISDRCYDNDASLNKGAMLNDACRAIDNPDWILLTDADVFLNERIPSLMRDFVLNPGVLYFTARHDIAEKDIPRWKAGKYYRQAPPSGLSPAASGYFTLFNRRALAIRDKWPNVNSEAFCSAGGVDTYFLHQWITEKNDVDQMKSVTLDDKHMNQFDLSKVIYLPEIPIQHIEHSQHFGQNWNGKRPVKPGQWRQLGMVSRNPQILAQFIEEIPAGNIAHVQLSCFQQFKTLDVNPVAGMHCRAIRMRTGESEEFDLIADEVGCHFPPEILDILAPAEGEKFPMILWKGEDIGQEFVQIEFREPG